MFNLFTLATTLLVTGASALPHQDAEILTNTAVIDMVTAKLPKDIILAKLQTTPNRFDVSVAGLVALNNAKVPKDLIKAMMAAASKPARPIAADAVPDTEPPAPLPDTSAEPAVAAPRTAGLERAGTPRRRRPILSAASIPPEPGIYLYADEGEGAELIPLEPTVYTAGKTSGTFVSAVTAGIAKAKIKAVLRNASAAIQTQDHHAEFYFVFEKKNSSLSGAGDWFQQLSSPNEFSLVRFQVKNNGREVVTAAVSAFGQGTGTEDKAVVGFAITRIKPGMYRVVPNVPLTAGEYAFVPPSSTPVGVPGAGGAQRLFDFGVGAR